MAKNANSMWGGRFAGGPDTIMEEINASIGFDKRLAPQDIQGSHAHVAMLAKCGILSDNDAKSIASGLDTIAREIGEGRFSYSAALEDIHMNIEHRLTELIGPAAGRMHTARSRNDQVALDVRLFVRDGLDQIDAGMAAYQKALAQKALDHADTLMPGYTHLQVAQPITFGHHLLAYVEMAARDRSRFADARARLNESPLGAAALAGTSFAIDRKKTAKDLGFDRPMANALDAVSARDYVIEVLAAIAICATHLSRLAEEIVIWSSAEFAFARLSHKFTTGSSIMPQKRNPDAAELVRGKTGRLNGALITVLTMMKGLPMAYGKDMQEDKEAFFDAYDTFALCLAAMTGMVDDIEPDVERMAEAAAGGYSTATDLADWLVRELDMPFRDAHHVTGAAVAVAEAGGCRLDELSLSALQAIEPGITDAVFAVLSARNAIHSRNSEGGTAPEQVTKLAKSWLKRLET